MELSKDDWTLTLNDLKTQRVQLALQTAVVEFGIVGIEKRLSEMPEGEMDEAEVELS